RLKAGRRLRLSVERAARHPLLDHIRRELACERLAATQRVAGGKLVRIGVTALNDVALHGQRPALVIGHGEIDLWRQPLLREAGRVDGPAPALTPAPFHPPPPPFPPPTKPRTLP